MNNQLVNIWQEEVTIPTYAVGEPDKNPMFFEKRVYQGSSGVVYPNPIIDKIYDEKLDKKYHAIFLENRFIKMMVLPELGGRIHMAFDKIANRHFIYYNEVIKPAFVGLCGPWISGGIEFNWPQHHRPSTFEPIDYDISENEDGSKTIWVNEIEKMFHTKAVAGFTLHPDKAYIEISVKLFNRTPFPQTFLWWANPAVSVNDQYQSVFPPDVYAVYDHGRRDVSDFPIARGEYYKVNYAPGTDISWYKNIPVPTSYMAVNSNYDFVGGYEHDTQAGLLHVADHHLSPGKKQWTWGNGDFGKAWDRNLTDNNGPYIELMTGVFTDNQPDFSWLMPYEEKSFTQYFLPYRGIGVIKNATKDLLLHFSTDHAKASVKLFATSAQAKLKLKIYYREKLIHKASLNIDPEKMFSTIIDLPANANEEDITVIILNEQQEVLLHYQFAGNKDQAVPEAAKSPAKPADAISNEELFLTGLHLEQYRHATFNPVDYYQEALKRDPADVRNNNALGLWYLRRGQFKKSEPYFRQAIRTLTDRNANPYDGEPLYNLGVCLQFQQRYKEAYDVFYKASWNSAWQATGFFALAQLDMKNRDYKKALYHIQLSLDRNAGNNKAMAIKIFSLRKMGLIDQAMKLCEEALKKDRFNLVVYLEQNRLWRLTDDKSKSLQALEKAYKLCRGDAHNFIEYAIDYSAAGLYEEAVRWLKYFLFKNDGGAHAFILYYLAYNLDKTGDAAQALTIFKQAAATKTGYYFPNRIEDILVLETALRYNPTDSNACYLLGCLWYDKRQYMEAIDLWKRSISIDDKLPAAHRNLGIALFNKRDDQEKAVECFERAFALDKNDARILMELDQLYKRMNKPAKERLEFLEQNLSQVLLRDDLYLERVALYNYLGKYEKACKLIMDHIFHPWEGGEGKVSAQYKYSLVQIARKQIAAGNFEEAINSLQKAQIYPHNLGEGKLYGIQENELFYWLAVACEGSGNKKAAVEYYEKSTGGMGQPTAAVFYNDQQPEIFFYQGMAWEKLGQPEKASAIFKRLLAYGKTHFNDKIEIDYFAVSLPDLLIFEDDISNRNRIHCLYMMALGYLGLKEVEMASSLFDEIVAADAMHFGAVSHAKLNLGYEKTIPGKNSLITKTINDPTV